MKSIRIVTVALLVLIVAPRSHSQTVEDFLKEFGKHLEESAKEQVDQRIDRAWDECRYQQRTAEVEQFETQRSGTFLVRDSSGAKYQLTSFTVAGQTEDGRSLADFFSLSTRASLQYAGGDQFTKKYVVHFTFGDVLSGGDSVLGQMFASATNSTLKSKMPNDVRAMVTGFGGRSLNGQQWCFALPDGNITSIELVP